MVSWEHSVQEMEVLLEGRAEAAAELYCSAPTSLSLRSGQPCTAVSVATAAWLLGQDAAEMAERTLQCVCVCVCARACVFRNAADWNCM